MFSVCSAGVCLCPAVPSGQVRHQLQQGLPVSQRRAVQPRHGTVPVRGRLQRAQVRSAGVWLTRVHVVCQNTEEK